MSLAILFVALEQVCDFWRTLATFCDRSVALGDRVDHPLSLDFMFQLPERRHDREQHGPHRCRRVDVAAQVQHTEANTATAEPFGEGENVLCRSSQPVQRRDDESVAGLECVEYTIEVRP